MPITASLGNGQGAACWLVVTSDGRFAYTANAATNNVSQYTIASNGSLALVGTGIAGTTPAGAITGFSVSSTNGSLTPIGGPSGLATGWAGLVAV